VTGQSVTLQIDPHLYQTLPGASPSDVVLCGLCSTLVYDTAPARARHLAWHERLFPGSEAEAASFRPVDGATWLASVPSQPATLADRA
jgi:hypothetical protein